MFMPAPDDSPSMAEEKRSHTTLPDGEDSDPDSDLARYQKWREQNLPRLTFDYGRGGNKPF